MNNAPGQRHVLFLQGLPSPFFARLAGVLADLGHEVSSVCFCFGDRVFWGRPNRTDFKGRRSEWPAFIEQYLVRRKVTDIVYVGEQRYYHQSAAAVAKRLKVQTVAADFGYLRPDWLAFEKEGMNPCSQFPRDPAAIVALADDIPTLDFSQRFHASFWSMVWRVMAYDFLNLFFFWLYPRYRRPYGGHNTVVNYLVGGWTLFGKRRREKHAEIVVDRLTSSERPFFLYPLQLEHDFSIQAYSRFPSQKEALTEILDSFARFSDSDDGLLVKLHPLDQGVIPWARIIADRVRDLGLEGRVWFVDGGDLDAIIRSSVGMITINSTAGLRALQLGRPVMVLGDAIYDIEGLTYRGGLNDFWRDKQGPDFTLRDAFVKALAATVHVRGVFYNEPGVSEAVSQAAARLDRDLVNAVLPELVLSSSK